LIINISNVHNLVIEVAKELPDFRAAAIISDAITKILPGAYCDIGTLMAEAKIIKENIKKIRENQSHVV
jgi:predicted ATP-grasp superfamily ATP-dependent carboligase